MIFSTSIYGKTTFFGGSEGGYSAENLTGAPYLEALRSYGQPSTFKPRHRAVCRPLTTVVKGRGLTVAPRHFELRDSRQIFLRATGPDKQAHQGGTVIRQTGSEIGTPHTPYLRACFSGDRAVLIYLPIAACSPAHIWTGTS